jgi:hypothetical protein
MSRSFFPITYHGYETSFFNAYFAEDDYTAACAVISDYKKQPKACRK